MRSTSDIVLVYKNDDDRHFEQPLADITSAGTLVDPDTGDDLELVSWFINPDSLWTVIGAWCNDEPLAFGAIHGGFPVEGDLEYEDHQPWATSVIADDADEAMRKAVAQMLATKA